jgi:calcineurin-like phosphoesterase family protein
MTPSSFLNIQLIFNRFLLSHIPVHPSQMVRWRGNIHGHLHANSLDDAWYTCVSVEQTEFKPVDLDQLIEEFNVSGT